MFQSLSIHNWRQFDSLEITFHPRLTILTGANGSGKTTVLNLLNRHWGWNIPVVSAPRLQAKQTRRYWAGFWDSASEQELPDTPQYQIGTIEYTDYGEPVQLTVPRDVEETFHVTIPGMRSVPGVYVSSHRPLYFHQPVENIPTTVDARDQIFNKYVNELRGRYTRGGRRASASHQLKQSLISFAVFGYPTEAVEANEEARETFEGFQQILRVVLPPVIGFQRLVIRTPDVALKTSSGTFAFDAVSGGISALIDIAWQVFLYSLLHEEFVVAIDEPEAHLHPELQRSVLPRLIEAFPRAQFVVATHNQFVVGSVPDSSVYVLRFNSEWRVVSALLDTVNKAGTSNEILRDALGLETTSGLWVERRLRRIVDRFSTEPIDADLLRALRAELSEVGLERYVPEAVIDLLASREDDSA